MWSCETIGKADKHGLRTMKALTIIYWMRAALGVTIGGLCSLYVYSTVAEELASFYTLLTGVSFALLFYMVTYYIIKFVFFAKVEKQSKLMTQGIGIYFFAWVVSWTLIVTLLLPSVSINIYNNETGNLLGGRELWVASRDSLGSVVQNVTVSSGSGRMALLSPGSYEFELGGDLGDYEVVNQNQTLTLGWLGSPQLAFNVSD
jgi:hypothetical protein